MKSIAVLIPCYNEENTIASVVESFKKHLPGATIHVYDNGSTDTTARIAKEAGAVVVTVKNRGKGNVVRKMFADINADIFVMVDGDSTYTADDAPHMIDLLTSANVDMVVAVRNAKSQNAYRDWHKIGNKFFNFILKVLFNSNYRDIFSGYRIFSRRFVKTFPATSRGFDIEAELSIHSLTLSIPFAEIDSAYLERPANSVSKLQTFRDGFRILFSILRLLRETKPMVFFGTISLIAFIIALTFAYPIVITFLETGLVPRLPTAMLSSGLIMISFLSLTCGMILDSVSQARLEMKKLHYLMLTMD
ncbi:MAG: glycosyltransferase family 2 protein [Holosporaceae bacterium]|jgi:glycosyltransferase involved in cell wall biosynthesis|nr:glycosyltransferase family 2 protein [Holosporaceae bacterium]